MGAFLQFGTPRTIAGRAREFRRSASFVESIGLMVGASIGVALAPTVLASEPPLPTMDEIADRYFHNRGPRARQNLTAELLGDPLPHRSALCAIPPCQDEIIAYRVPGLPRIKFLERT